MENKINYQFKVLYALGIIFVVIGHIANNNIHLFLNNIFPVDGSHLALFVFASGYFYKKEVENSLLQYIIKKIKHLIIPMYIWNLIYGLICLFLRENSFNIGDSLSLNSLLIAPWINGHQFTYSMCLWFIPPLFLTEIGTASIRKVLHTITKNEYILCLFFLGLGILGVQLAIWGYNKDWMLLIVRTLYFIPFFSMGILYREKIEKKDTLSNTKYLIILLCLQLISILYFGKAVAYNFSWCRSFTDGPIMPFIAVTIGIAFWLRIAKILEPICKNSSTIMNIANNTYAILLHQFIGFMFVKSIFAILNKLLGLCQDFNFLEYQSTIFYYYYPKGLNAFAYIYVLAGIFIPLWINNIIIKSKKHWINLIYIIFLLIIIASSANKSMKVIKIDFVSYNEKSFSYQIFYKLQKGCSTVPQRVTVGKYFFSKKIELDKLEYFRLDFGSNPGRVKVCNLTIFGDKNYKLTRIEDFKTNDINKITQIDKNCFEIESDKIDPFIVYKGRLDVRGK